jgi:DNA-binding CsgD family transcriptional regulator
VGTKLRTKQIEKKEVLRLLALCYSNKEIAEILETDVETIAALKTDAMKKLGLKGRIDIIRYIQEQENKGGVSLEAIGLQGYRPIPLTLTTSHLSGVGSRKVYSRGLPSIRC